MGVRARRLGENVNRISKVWLVAASLLIAYGVVALSQDGGKQPLRLVQTMSLPNVKGRLDHMDVDVKGKRLFVAGLEIITAGRRSWMGTWNRGSRITSLGNF
jgi:hypothetical protein